MLFCFQKSNWQCPICVYSFPISALPTGNPARPWSLTPPRESFREHLGWRYSPHRCCYHTHTHHFSFMPQQTRPEERPHRMSGVRRQYLRSTLFSRTGARAHELSRIVNLTLVVFRDSELFQRLHGIWSSGSFTCSLESSSELASVGWSECGHCVCVFGLTCEALCWEN